MSASHARLTNFTSASTNFSHLPAGGLINHALPRTKLRADICLILCLRPYSFDAQIASAPLASEPVNAPSMTPNGSPQVRAAGKFHDLRIGIGDLLQITMFGTQDFNSDFRVSPSGDISVPTARHGSCRRVEYVRSRKVD